MKNETGCPLGIITSDSEMTFIPLPHGEYSKQDVRIFCYEFLKYVLNCMKTDTETDYSGWFKEKGLK
jgi:hypothetical protein